MNSNSIDGFKASKLREDHLAYLNQAERFTRNTKEIPIMMFRGSMSRHSHHDSFIEKDGKVTVDLEPDPEAHIQRLSNRGLTSLGNFYLKPGILVQLFY